VRELGTGHSWRWSRPRAFGPGGRSRRWALVVERFESPEVRVWGEMADSEAYPDQELLPAAIVMTIDDHIQAALPALWANVSPADRSTELPDCVFCRLIRDLSHVADRLSHDGRAITREAYRWHREDLKEAGEPGSRAAGV
jgi:hypothetical protein